MGTARKGWIVVADADAELRALVMHTLRGAGYGVVTCVSGTTLLDFLGTLLVARSSLPPPTALLLDVHMRGWNGIDIVRGFARAGWSIPAVLIAGRHDATVAREAAQLGAAVVTKPIDGPALLRTLERTLAAPGRRASSPSVSFAARHTESRWHHA